MSVEGISMKGRRYGGLFVVLAVMLGVVSATTSTASKGLEEIEHIIIFMQENRAFDHYFGTLQGVRGFNDRTPIMLANGHNAFHQPVQTDNTQDYMLPFRTIANETNAMCMPAPNMAYQPDIGIWNKGRFDAWNTARDAGYGMSYFTREDLPYYYHLYDAFTVADHYYQSTFTATNPNRMHLFAGSNGLSVGEKAVLDNSEPHPGYNWTTVAETLTAKNISWRVYQQTDNFDDNAFAWFKNFQQSRPGDLLFDMGMKRQKSLIETFRKDLADGTLPAVSWLIAPTRKSEHASNHPCAGEDFTARILKALQEHPKMYAKSVFVLNYDEGGQFYDHAWAPTPPVDAAAGYSSVTVEGEVNSEVFTTEPNPIGLGFRVPMLLISPWTRGNKVYSAVMDHTSVIQLIEQRFNVQCENISPWRRMVTDDITHAFDFENPDYSWPELPDTSKYVIDGDIECKNLPAPIIPAEQHMPKQEEGTRLARPLPYEFSVSSEVVADASSKKAQLVVKITNSGEGGAAFILYDLAHIANQAPRQFALAAKSAEYVDKVDVTSTDGSYHFALFGPNGFLREFRGSAFSTQGSACPSVDAKIQYSSSTDEVIVSLSNAGVAATTVQVEDKTYGLIQAQQVAVPVSQTVEIRVSTKASSNWYDFVASVEGECSMYRRFMGHMENGKETTSDPAMGKGLPGWMEDTVTSHPTLPEKLRVVAREEPVDAKFNKDARFYTKEEYFTEEL